MYELRYGREIYKDGKPMFYISSLFADSASKERSLTGWELDDYSKKIVEALNKQEAN
jgi:hypothetical protein